jgi:hypothetical protein
VKNERKGITNLTLRVKLLIQNFCICTTNITPCKDKNGRIDRFCYFIYIAYDPYFYGVVVGIAIKSTPTALSTKLITWLGCWNVYRRELTVTMYVSPACSPSKV